MHLLHAAQLAPVQRVSGYGLRGELDPPRLGVLDKLHVMVLVHGLGLGVLNKLRVNIARTARNSSSIGHVRPETPIRYGTYSQKRTAVVGAYVVNVKNLSPEKAENFQLISPAGFERKL